MVMQPLHFSRPSIVDMCGFGFQECIAYTAEGFRTFTQTLLLPSSGLITSYHHLSLTMRSLPVGQVSRSVFMQFIDVRTIKTPPPELLMMKMASPTPSTLYAQHSQVTH
jgi:hypothetical protein